MYKSELRNIYTLLESELKFANIRIFNAFTQVIEDEAILSAKTRVLEN